MCMCGMCCSGSVDNPSHAVAHLLTALGLIENILLTFVWVSLDDTFQTAQGSTSSRLACQEDPAETHSELQIPWWQLLQ